MTHCLGHQDDTGGVVVAVSCGRPATSPNGGGCGHVMSQACHVTRWWWKVMEALSLVSVVSRKISKINLSVKQNKKE